MNYHETNQWTTSLFCFYYYTSNNHHWTGRLDLWQKDGQASLKNCNKDEHHVAKMQLFVSSASPLWFTQFLSWAGHFASSQKVIHSHTVWTKSRATIGTCRPIPRNIIFLSVLRGSMTERKPEYRVQTPGIEVNSCRLNATWILRIPIYLPGLLCFFLFYLCVLFYPIPLCFALPTEPPTSSPSSRVDSRFPWFCMYYTVKSLFNWIQHTHHLSFSLENTLWTSQTLRSSIVFMSHLLPITTSTYFIYPWRWSIYLWKLN